MNRHIIKVRPHDPNKRLKIELLDPNSGNAKIYDGLNMDSLVDGEYNHGTTIRPQLYPIVSKRDGFVIVDSTGMANYDFGFRIVAVDAPCDTPVVEIHDTLYIPKYIHDTLYVQQYLHDLRLQQPNHPGHCQRHCPSRCHCRY